MTGCKACDTHGPCLSNLQYDLITLHRTVHDIGRELLSVFMYPSKAPRVRLERRT